MNRTLWTVTLMLMPSGLALAEPEAAPGEGRELFIARCSSCHSVDYVEMHARFGTRALWESQVTKMRNAYKAPMSDEDAQIILNYLERQYGPGRTDTSQSTTPRSSMSKTSVASGLMVGGAPRSP
ncbi:MAG: cytochrome c [Gammaproteobacteria bacterium]|nr:cytochrome c [Gammaproteobacteria bacterium]